MEFKIGDDVIIICLGSVWTIRFIRVVPDTGRTYFVSQENKTMWVDEYEIEPAIPRESRKELKKRIKGLEQKLADAQEAVRIVEALEKMPCYWKLCKNGYGEWLFHDNTDSDHPDRLTGRPRHTISQALQAAGLMEEKEE